MKNINIIRLTPSEAKGATRKLLMQRNDNDQLIESLKDRNREITIKLCALVGRCPSCHENHYPHCQR